MTYRSLLAVAASGALALTLAGCGSSTTDQPAAGSSASPSASSPAASPAAVAAPLELVDGWAKATEGAPGMAEMTGVFGTLKNTGSTPVHITGGSSPVAGMVEMHETVKTAAGAMQMQKAPDGFTIPAGGEFVLKPGGNHIMLMELKEPVKVGATVEVVLVTDDGEFPVSVSARAFSGGQESYNPSPSASMSH